MVFRGLALGLASVHIVVTLPQLILWLSISSFGIIRYTRRFQRAQRRYRVMKGRYNGGYLLTARAMRSDSISLLASSILCFIGFLMAVGGLQTEPLYPVFLSWAVQLYFNQRMEETFTRVAKTQKDLEAILPEVSGQLSATERSQILEEARDSMRRNIAVILSSRKAT